MTTIILVILAAMLTAQFMYHIVCHAYAKAVYSCIELVLFALLCNLL